jgi:hypothetical protein
VKDAVEREGIVSAEEEAASTSSVAADNPRKTFSARATCTAKETFRRREANNLPTFVPIKAVAYLTHFVKHAATWPTKAPNSVTAIMGMKHMSR